MKFPWEVQLPAVPIEDTVAALQRDFAYAVQMTAIRVHSNNPELATLVNVPRGQIIPRGVCRFTDGSTVEFQDVGMPQIDVPSMTVHELVAHVWATALIKGLEIVP